MLPLAVLRYQTDHEIALPIYVPAIDWSVITIILGASLFVESDESVGYFPCCDQADKAIKGDPWRLLIFYGALTVIFLQYSTM